MYIRIQNSKLRFRVSKIEAMQLISGDHISDSIQFMPASMLNYTVTCTEEITCFECNPEEKNLILSVNRERLLNEIKSRPSKNGIEIHFDNGCNIPLIVSLEVDLKNKN